MLRWNSFSSHNLLKQEAEKDNASIYEIQIYL